LQVVILWIW